MRRERWSRKLAGKNSVSINWYPEELLRSLNKLPQTSLRELGSETSKYAFVAQNHSRTNAPWTDRTGNARQGLFATPFNEDGGFEIVLYHTMPYGIYLERRWDGRWGIIPETVQRVSRVYTAAMTKRLSDLLRSI